MITTPARFFAGVVVLFCTVWISAWTAQLFWLLWPVQALAASEPLRVLNRDLLAESANGNPGVDMESLLAFRWFETLTPDNNSPDNNSESASRVMVETKLALRLQGAIPSSTSAAGGAIIAAGERQTLVSVGEFVEIAPPGVRLAEVFADRVVLDNNGRRESLWLYAPSPFGRGEADAVPQEVAKSDSQPVGRAQLHAPLTIEDFGAVQIVREEGRVVGFAIGNDADAAALARYGLRVGDVVTAIDGQTLASLGQASAAVQALTNSNQAQLGLLRDGERLSHTLRYAP
ncbi:MAG: type II secretion system protein N [Pseudohongiellaceae bacterium]